MASAKGISLELETDENLPVLSINLELIQRVFQNLIGNALKFTPKGGMIRINAHRRDGELLFCVKDDGEGIDPEFLPRIFERFAQGKDKASLGAGLGLSIAKGVIIAHGGKIWVESAKGKGSKFFFTLPLE